MYSVLTPYPTTSSNPATRRTHSKSHWTHSAKNAYTSTKETYTSAKEPKIPENQIHVRCLDTIPYNLVEACNIGATRENLLIHSAKESCICTKEPCTSEKEPYQSAKEPCIFANQMESWCLDTIFSTNRRYGVATISRLQKIIRLFCKRALSKRRYSAKETYNFKEPTNRRHPIRCPDAIVVKTATWWRPCMIMYIHTAINQSAKEPITSAKEPCTSANQMEEQCLETIYIQP